MALRISSRLPGDFRYYLLDVRAVISFEALPIEYLRIGSQLAALHRFQFLQQCLSRFKERSPCK